MATKDNPIIEAFEANAADPHPEDYYDLSRKGIAELWVQYLQTGNQDISWEPKHLMEAMLYIAPIANWEPQPVQFAVEH